MGTEYCSKDNVRKGKETFMGEGCVIGSYSHCSHECLFPNFQ